MPSAAENHEVKRVNKFTGEYPQNYCFSYKQTRKKGLLLHKIRIFADKYLLGERIKTTYYFFCPRITRIFVQASAEPNDCVKPNEQNRVYSNFAMASNRTFKNLFEFCRAQPKMSRNLHESLHRIEWRPVRSHEFSLIQSDCKKYIAFV